MTASTFDRPEPAIVIVVPPDRAPAAGETPETAGAAEDASAEDVDDATGVDVEATGCVLVHADNTTTAPTATDASRARRWKDEERMRTP